MDVWDTARLLKVPGVDAHVFIDPAKVPTRTKRSAQRMLRDGFYHGTWGSKTKQLAVLVRDASAPQPFISTRYSRPREGGIQAYYPMQLTLCNYELPREVAREVIELVRADLSILQMTQPERDGFYHGGVGNQKAFLAEWDNRTEARFHHAAFFCDNYAIQAIDLIKATRTPEQVEQARAIADRLDSHEHIQVPTTFK